MTISFNDDLIKRNLICKEADKANSASMRMPDQPDPIELQWNISGKYKYKFKYRFQYKYKYKYKCIH